MTVPAGQEPGLGERCRVEVPAEAVIVWPTMAGEQPLAMVS
jgi:hypothetical protein